jgi:hypothetical protein
MIVFLEQNLLPRHLTQSGVVKRLFLAFNAAPVVSLKANRIAPVFREKPILPMFFFEATGLCSYS